MIPLFTDAISRMRARCSHSTYRIVVTITLLSANQLSFENGSDRKAHHGTNIRFPWGPHTGEKFFHGAMSPSFPSLQRYKLSKDKVLLFLFFRFLFYMSTSTIREATSTLAYLAPMQFWSPFSRHIVLCLPVFVHVNFTICPWGIITFRMCMSSRPHCCHWTAYKGLRTGLLLSSALCYSPPALQAVTNLSLQHDL